MFKKISHNFLTSITVKTLGRKEIFLKKTTIQQKMDSKNWLKSVLYWFLGGDVAKEG
jgi:hypothetical protein